LEEARDTVAKAVGARPDPFRTVRFSEKLLQRSGITTCSIIDYPSPSADAAGVLQQMLSDHISTTGAYVSFSYQYLAEVSVARFIFTGPADQVSKLVKIVRKKG